MEDRILARRATPIETDGDTVTEIAGPRHQCFLVLNHVVSSVVLTVVLVFGVCLCVTVTRFSAACRNAVRLRETPNFTTT
jgi:ABC-type sulfate transport system permease subunit